MNRVILGDNLAALAEIPDESIDLIYIDPPFNTGKTQKRDFMKTVKDPLGDRAGFKGERYRSEAVSSASFEDTFVDYLGFLRPRVEEAKRVLKKTGTFYFHVDAREVHYCKVMLDGIFGRDRFLNEIIWAYDYGAKSKSRWPAKHDNILVYVKSDDYVFNVDEIDRIPYMAPGLVGPEKAARGKLPTDVWFHTIVSPTGKEKMGYPTQKPVGILRRIVAASAPKGGLCLDFFAGAGSLGAAALDKGREFIMVDSSPLAYSIMQKRFAGRADIAFESGPAAHSGVRTG